MNTWYIYLEHDSHTPPCSETLDGGTHISYKLNAFATVSFGCSESSIYSDTDLTLSTIEVLKAARWWDVNGSILLTADDTIYVNDVLYSSPATHRVDYNLSALPADISYLIAANITTISDELGLHLPLPSTVKYVSSTYSDGIFSIYLQDTAPLLLSASYSIMVLAPADIWSVAVLIGGILLFAIGVIIALLFSGFVALGVAAIAMAAGAITVGFTVYDLLFGSEQPGTANRPALTNDELTTALGGFITKAAAGCPTTTMCGDPALTLTQDQKAICVKDCAANLTNNAAPLLDKLFPNADHSPVSNTASVVQACYDIYVASAKTSDDYNIYVNCMKLKIQDAVSQDKANTLDKYDAGASAGEPCKAGYTYDTTTMACVANPAADCWIKGPSVAGVSTGCVLSASTGKSLAVVGGLLIAAYILIKK